MYKKRARKPTEEEERLKEDAKRKRQERFERCLKCRYLVKVVNVVGEDRITCPYPVSAEDVCPKFVRKWPEGLNPITLLE